MLINVVASYLVAMVFILYCLVLGTGLLNRIGIRINSFTDSYNAYLFAFFAIAGGMVAVILALMLLGLTGLLKPTIILIAALLLMLPAIFKLGYLRKYLLLSNSQYLLWPAILMLLAVAFAWKAPGHWDDTSFHLPLVRFYVEQQGIELQEYLRFPLFPQHMNMLMVLGYLSTDAIGAGGAVGAQVFATLPWFVIALGFMGISKWHMGSAIPGVVVAILLAKNIEAFRVGFGFAYVDTGLAMFCWAALLAMVIGIANDSGQKTQSLTWIILAGLLAGGAAGTKLFGGVFALILCITVLLATRKLLYSVVFGICVLATGAWWYVRSYLISGDPFHPIAANFFGYFLWNEQDLLAQVAEQKTHGVAPSLLNLWAALKDAGIELWAIALAGLVFFKKLPSSIRLMQLVFVVYFGFWFFVTQVERYLAPIMAVGTYLAFYMLYRLVNINIGSFNPGTYIARYSRALTVITVLLCCSLIFGEFRRNIANWDHRLSRVSGYELFTQANGWRASHGDRLVQLGFENAAYFFSGITIGDVFGVARYSQMLDCRAEGCKPVGTDALVELLNKFNSKMVIVSTQQYPLLNEQQYINHFDIAFKNEQGVLMLLKQEEAKKQDVND